MRDGCRPRLYVYRLPESYRDPVSAHMPADGVGRPLRLQLPGIENACWDADQYSLASLVYQRALSYRCRTHEPASADLFLVPAFKASLGGKGSQCAEFGGNRTKTLRQRLRVELPNASRPAGWGSAPLTALEARGGADHIILNPRSGMSWERNPYCEVALGAPLFGAALHLAMEQAPRNGSWVYPEGYCGKVCVDAYYPQLLSEPWYWSVPWTSLVHLDVNAAPTPPWASKHTRSTLISAHFGTVHWPVLPRPTLQLRTRLIAQCKAQPSKCSYVPPRASAPERTAALYWESTFCLQPGGDTITRKAMIDALLLGCIPVLFHEGQRQQWGWHWGSWMSHATVVLNQSAIRHGQLDAIDFLSSIPTAKVSSMRTAIRRHAHRMHYSAIDTSNLPSALRGWATPDAFEVILEGAWQVARDRRLQALGRTLQRTRKGGRETWVRRMKVAASVESEDDSSGELDGVAKRASDRLLPEEIDQDDPDERRRSRRRT
jgi:hypothetical protein